MDEFSRRINILGESIGVMLEERLSRVESKICYIERETKTKNILIHGIEEKETNLLELENGTNGFIKEKIYNEFKTSQINFIKRIGRPQKGTYFNISPLCTSLKYPNEE